MSPPPESPPRGTSRRVPRFVSCLVKGPLGCLFFLIGAGAVLVLLLPPAGGRVADRFVEEWFAERHLGTLELADAWVGSFYGQQRIDSVILRDPEDDEVLRASLRAPTLTDLIDYADGARGDFGPIVIRIASLRIVQARDGSTNLSRALAPRASGDAARGERRGVETDRPIELALEVWIERLRYTDLRGREGSLDGSVLRGKLVWGPTGTRLVLDGGPDAGTSEPASVHLALAWREPDPVRPWSVEIGLERVPSALAGVLCTAAQPLASFAGTTLDELVWKRDETRVELGAKDERAELALRGALEEGAIAGDEASVRLTLPCSDGRAGRLLSFLVPLLEAPECSAEDPLELRLAPCRWPLGGDGVGDWTTLAGELELALPPARARLVPAVQAALAGEEPLHALLDGLRARLPVRDGVLEYASLRLPTEKGWLEVEGTLELATGSLEAHVRGESGGEPRDLGRWSGTRGELVPRPVEPPASPAAPTPVEPEATPDEG